jgi:hypothetical protein
MFFFFYASLAMLHVLPPIFSFIHNTKVEFTKSDVLLRGSRYESDLHPLEILIQKDRVDLISKIFRYEMKSSFQRETAAVVDLFSMVHIGDGNYYKEIQRLCKDYDVVLYELITSEDLVSYEGGDSSRKKLI